MPRSSQGTSFLDKEINEDIDNHYIDSKERPD